MAMPTVTQDHTTWQFQQSHIERLMDHAALTSAHPDDTLLLAGPARYTMTSKTDTDFYEKLLPIGMVQSFTAALQKPTQPMQAIGSARTYYVSGKAQGNANMARLFVNGRNMLRVLYTNAVQAGLDVSSFDDKAAAPGNNTFFMNLDSELFLIPFGLACFFRDKLHNSIGAFYLELCALNSYNIGFNAGQNLILEQVSMLFDRALPMSFTAGAAQAGHGLTETELANENLLGKTTTEIYPNEDTM